MGNKAEQPAVVQKRGMKGDLVLYDSLVWLMGSLEGRPACQGPQTSWQRTASAAEPGSPQPLQALPSPTPSCPSANQCPAVGKLHLPLRIHPWTSLLVQLPCLMFPLDPSLLSPVSAILCMGRSLLLLPRCMSSLLGTFLLGTLSFCGFSLLLPGHHTVSL